nr:hypothetical protein [Tanacetum cinerariifolium]
MVAYLNKSDATEGFDQIIDFLNGSYVKLQALVDRKKVVLTNTVIREVLRLDDAEGIDCLPNEEIFIELARMGYEKPSTKLTFYKAFFSSQWKFLMKFNFSKYIFKSLVRNVDSSSKFYMYPRFLQLIIQNQLGDLSSHTTKYISSALTQKVFANMRRVEKGFSKVETPLFEGMLVIGENVEKGIVVEQVQVNDVVAAAQEVQPTPPPSPQPQPQAADFPFGLLQTTLDTCAALTSRIEQLDVKVFKRRKLKKVGTSQRIDTLDDTIMEDVSNQGRLIDELDRDEGVPLTAENEEERKTEEAKNSVGDDQVKGRQAEIYQNKLVSAASTTIPAAKLQVPAATPTAVPVRVVAASIRRRKRVVIRDPKEESTAKTPAKTKSNDKGKGIMIEEPKPMKKKQQVEMDEEYAKKLHEELNQDIDWNVAIDHVKQKAKEDPYVQMYQVIKKRPQTEAQARRNMIMYLKNTAGFRLDYFKGMSYDDIRPIFEAKFNSNIEFFLKSKEQIKEEENRALESINETPAQKAATRRKINKEVSVMDYSIIFLNNKPHYKIVKADGTHQLYTSFLTLLKNFDRDDLESLWSIVKERFSTTKPDNFTYDFLLTTLKTMFEEADDQAQIWKNRRTVYGEKRVKSWKLLESYGVHIVTLSTIQLILLVEMKYPLSRYTLDQILNTVRLRVEEQSEMSLELLRFIRQQ